jgi:hypothetical protein
VAKRAKRGQRFRDIECLASGPDAI